MCKLVVGAERNCSLEFDPRFGQPVLNPAEETHLGVRSRVVRVAFDRFEKQLSGLPMTINGASVRRLPNTSNITFHGADAEGIVIGLDLNGVAVSTGTASNL